MLKLLHSMHVEALPRLLQYQGQNTEVMQTVFMILAHYQTHIHQGKRRT